MIFDSNSSHITYHNMLNSKNKERFIVTENDNVFNCKYVYINICLICGKNTSRDKNICSNCYNISNRKVKRPNKDKLVDILYENNGNFTKIAKEFGVSDNAVRKWCRYYNLQTHSRDYKKY